jgi:hypothetical protein
MLIYHYYRIKNGGMADKAALYHRMHKIMPANQYIQNSALICNTHTHSETALEATASVALTMTEHACLARCSRTIAD